MATIGQPIPLGIIHPEDYENLGIEQPSQENAVSDLGAIRDQVAELRESVSRLTKAAVKTAKAHPLATAAVISLGLWALAGMSARGVRRRWF